MPPWNILLGRGSKAGGSSSSTSEGASPTPGSNALSDQADAQQADSVEEADPIPLTAKGRAKSNKIPKKKDSLIKQYYKRYELDWPDLRRWLEAKFEGIEFKEGYVRDGPWVWRSCC